MCVWEGWKKRRGGEKKMRNCRENVWEMQWMRVVKVEALRDGEDKAKEEVEDVAGIGVKEEEERRE